MSVISYFVGESSANLVKPKFSLHPYGVATSDDTDAKKFKSVVGADYTLAKKPSDKFYNCGECIRAGYEWIINDKTKWFTQAKIEVGGACCIPGEYDPVKSCDLQENTGAFTKSILPVQVINSVDWSSMQFTTYEIGLLACPTISSGICGANDKITTLSPLNKFVDMTIKGKFTSKDTCVWLVKSNCYPVTLSFDFKNREGTVLNEISDSKS